MKDYPLTKHNIHDFFEVLQDELEINPSLVVSSQSAGTGKWGMARLWRSWMATTAKFMAKNGVTMPLITHKDGHSKGARPFNQYDAHELFTSYWLNLDAEGNRLSWAKDDNNGRRKATKGERFDALRKHENYCMERGIVLLTPRDSEFNKLKENQCK